MKGPVQAHEKSFIFDAPPADVWALMWPPAPPDLTAGEIQVIEFGDVRIEIVHQGDENHDGLVRHCYYPIPKYVLSRGRAESWELITEVVPNVSCRYRAITRPPFAEVEGFQRLREVGDGRTELTFTETYSIRSSLLRVLLERPLHRAISRDNDQLFEGLRQIVDRPGGVT